MMIQAVVVVIKADTAICLENKRTRLLMKGKRSIVTMLARFTAFSF